MGLFDFLKRKNKAPEKTDKEPSLDERISSYIWKISKNRSLPYMRVTKLLFPIWSCEDFIDVTGSSDVQDIYLCKPVDAEQGNAFYAYLRPCTYGGYIGCIIGGMEEIFISEFNYTLELAPQNFVAPIANSACQLNFIRGNITNSVFGYMGVFPELYAYEIILDTPELKKKIVLPKPCTYWSDIKDLVADLDKEYAQIKA